MKFFSLFMSSLAMTVGLSSIEAATKREVQLIDVGVIGLTSHDLISWDRESFSLRNPKGRLDLSTLFDWTDARTGENTFLQGGDPKNAENAVVFSVVNQLLGVFLTHQDLFKLEGQSAEEAYKNARVETIRYYHKMVRVSFARLYGIPFPEFVIDDGKVTHEEHAVMRAAHHILPGKMLVSYGPTKKEIALTNFMFAQMNLPAKDWIQPGKIFDGKYEAEYLDFKIPFGPRAGESLNLYEIDKAFVEDFTDFNFDQMVDELGSKGSFEGVSFAEFLKSLYAKGMSSKDNPWLSQLN